MYTVAIGKQPNPLVPFSNPSKIQSVVFKKSITSDFNS